MTHTGTVVNDPRGPVLETDDVSGTTLSSIPTRDPREDGVVCLYVRGSRW